MSKYLDLNKILPYQRNFNFINGERSIGKTYTIMKFVINKCLQRGVEFVYLVRTKNQKKAGALGDAFKKVLLNEFSGYRIECTNEDMVNIIETEEKDEKIQLGYCLALSEKTEVKQRSFPKVKYIIFDEYMLETNNQHEYYKGWKEPDEFLNLYHTIDREEDRVICFLLGNNTSFYNPYHLHPAFNIPFISKGELWTSENVLFYWAQASEELKEDKAKSKFIKMIDKTDYSDYAVKGDYIYDEAKLIEPAPKNARLLFTIEINKIQYGFYYLSSLFFITPVIKGNPQIRFVVNRNDMKEGFYLATKDFSYIKLFISMFKRSMIRYESMQTKAIIQNEIFKLL